MEDGDAEYYRAMSLPEKVSQYEKPLIERKLLQQFLQHCVEYIHDKNKLDLYLPIMYLVNSYRPESDLESRFLSAYASLEALLNLYGESQGKRKYIEGELSKQFFSSLKESIENLSGVDDNARNGIIDKISELNRVSSHSKYKDFCKEKGVVNSDLWYVYSNNYLSLYDIRNGLVHGKRFEYMPRLITARDHMQWAVERCLLAALEWDEPANVQPDFLSSNYPNYSKWKGYSTRESKKALFGRV